MKKAIIILIVALNIITVAFSQTKAAKEAKLKAEIIALDKLAWEAWKNGNAAWFKKHTTEGFLSITSEGVSNKTDVIRSTPTECQVKSYSLNNFEFVMLNETAVLLTYTATQDAVCGGKKNPAKIRVSVNYVKQGGKWLEAFYMDTAID